MDVILPSLIDVLRVALNIYWWVLLIWVIMSWLINFNMINTYQPFVRGLWKALQQLTEPVLRPLRRVIPMVGNLDLSPLILILILYFLDGVLLRLSLRLSGV